MGDIREATYTGQSHCIETLSALLVCCEWMHQSLGDPLKKASIDLRFDVFFDVSLNQLLNKQLSDQWY